MTRANPHSTAREDGSCDDCGSFHGGYNAASVTFNGMTLPVFDLKYANKEIGPILGEGMIGGYSFECTMEISKRDYYELLRGLEPSKPRWGMRGRRRLRKARGLARLCNETVQMIRASVTRAHHLKPSARA